MQKITIKTSKEYDVFVGAGVLDDAGAIVKRYVGGNRSTVVAIVTDDIVAPMYGGRFRGALEKSGYQVIQYVFPNGEDSKNAATFLSILNFLATQNIGRTDIVAALGGGVAGDLAGFAAACYLRGIRLVQVPTTLLAAVDSSVGGKTAINLPTGKNMAGAFYQPEVVICDVSTLSTLPAGVFRDGAAEVIKHGIIADRPLFNSLKEPIQDRLETVVARNVEIKRDIVAADEFEAGDRKLLNLGHTVGHAIEALSNHATPHGSAVATGMAIVARAAARMGICGDDCTQNILDMLKRYALPTTTIYDAKQLAHACIADKKRDGKDITMIFPEKIGKCIMKKIKIDDLESVIEQGLDDV